METNKNCSNFIYKIFHQLTKAHQNLCALSESQSQVSKLTDKEWNLIKKFDVSNPLNSPTLSDFKDIAQTKARAKDNILIKLSNNIETYCQQNSNSTQENTETTKDETTNPTFKKSGKTNSPIPM